jgi:CBS-domain-containing membrane protein
LRTAVPVWRFAFFRVIVNSLLLALVGVFYNRATGRGCPHTARNPVTVEDQAPLPAA